MTDERIRVFISHSSRDRELVERLIDLLVSALHLPAGSIRATSVDGHRLEGGANTEATLRREVDEAEVLVGVLTPDSLDSLYVAFELGGRWVTGRPLVPLLAPGADADLLAGPLQWLNALRCTPGELHQLVRELGEKLNIEPDRPDAYQRHIERILQMEAAAETRAEPRRGRARKTNGMTESDADAEAVIQQKCERDWPDDFQMRAHCMKQQRQALAELHRGNTGGVPEGIFDGIREKAAAQWPDDFQMRLHAEKQQLDAYQELHPNH